MLVATSAMKARRMAFDLSVILAETRTPSLLTPRGPRLKRGAPAKVTGTTSHRKRMNPLTRATLLATSTKFSLHTQRRAEENRRAPTRVGKPFERATTNAYMVAETTFNLGSRRCICDRPSEKASRIMPR